MSTEPRIVRDGTGAFHRRHELLALDATTVVAGIEDDMHRFELTLRHDGERVASIEGRAVRWPWAPCLDSPGALAALVGMPLDSFPAAVGGFADARAQCTHLFDLAGIAVAHAARHVAGGAAARSYLAVVPDWFEPPYVAWIERDGSEVLRWTVGPDSSIANAPEPFARLRLNRRFVEWCRENLDDDTAEAAFLLRRAAWMSPARHIDLEAIPTVEGSPIGRGVCFTAQPGRIEIARRNRDSLRDFGTHPEDLLSGFPPNRPRRSATQQIRARRPEDEATALALLEHVHALDGYPVHFPGARAFLLPPYEIAAWVAEEDGEVVGHVALHHDVESEALIATCEATGLAPSDVLTVSRLFVAPSARRRGVARALLDHAASEATKRGRRPILDVVKGFEAAVGLYERAGWQGVGEITWHIPDGAEITSLLFVRP